MASVTLKNLVKSFKNVVAVNNVTLEIFDKEFLVLVGPSGCGKTTALRCVAGLEEATDGEILIGDRVVNDVLPKDRDIAMVFQNYALYPHMSVYDNMAFGLRLRKVTKPEIKRRGVIGLLTRLTSWLRKVPEPEIKRRVEEAAELLGLENLLQRKPKQLSGGQRQRVALGRAIVREPAVFLMDEPLSNLDAKLRVQTRAELIKLHRRLGITTIYVTHDQVEAMTMGDRIAVMKDGVVQQLDTPLGLYHHPVNVFVAGFIGTPSMNFLDATLEADGGEAALINTGAFKVKIPASKYSHIKNAIGRQVVFGVRPEDIFDKNLKNLIEATPDNTVSAMVDVVEPMGAIDTIYLKMGDHSIVATIDAETSAKEQQSLDVVLDMEKTHVFDKETDKAYY